MAAVKEDSVCGSVLYDSYKRELPEQKKKEKKKIKRESSGYKYF